MAKRGRKRLPATTIDLVRELAAAKLSWRDIAAECARRGVAVSVTSVGNILAPPAAAAAPPPRDEAQRLARRQAEEHLDRVRGLIRQARLAGRPLPRRPRSRRIDARGLRPDLAPAEAQRLAALRRDRL